MIAVFQSIQMLCPIAIVILLLAGTIKPWMIVGFSIVVGVTDALSMPSFQSIVPSIVERNQIATGITLNSTQFNLSRIVGPALAGAPTMLGGSVLCGPLLTFVPVLARVAFQGSAGYFATAMAAFGVGGLLGGAALLGLPSTVDRRWVASACAIGLGASLIGIALNPWAPALPVLLVFGSAFMTAANTSANSLLQMAAPPRLLGRVVSLYTLAMRGGISVGAPLAGAAIGMVGPRRAFLIDGVARSRCREC